MMSPWRLIPQLAAIRLFGDIFLRVAQKVRAHFKLVAGLALHRYYYVLSCVLVCFLFLPKLLIIFLIFLQVFSSSYTDIFNSYSGVYLYVLATSSSGIHYVNVKRQCLQMFSSYNPFLFDADYATASFSGVKCTLKSEQSCYVQAFWGVPIYPLFELLQGNWQSLRNAVITHIPSEKFSSKCVCANEPFKLSAGEEKTIEFKPRWDTDESTLCQGSTHMRQSYPLVILMILNNKDDIQDSLVVAMASVVHIPDKNLLLYPQLIGQYIKLSSGHVGQVKKIFLSSPATSDDGGSRYDLCLACYHRPVSVVFLPCRHACLCSVCFDLCERCPVCRAASMHYFELPDSEKGV